ncbi:MAG: EAL domain-containing protein [Desulfobacteraceae bacterium]|nr:EAL domain-containing protein [Desulfobacteraceae bacterium]
MEKTQLTRGSAFLQGERKFLETVLMHIPVGVIIAEAPSGKLILGNKQVERILRQPFLQAAAIGEYGGYKGFHPDGRPYQPEEWPLARSLHGETISGEEIDFLRGDGTHGLMRVSSSPVRDEEGRIIAGVVTLEDISARREAEEALRLSEARFRNLFGQSPVSMQIFSPDGRTVEVNRAWEKLWGLTLEATRGYNVLQDQQLAVKGALPYLRKAFAGEAAEIPAIFYEPAEAVRKGRARWVRGFIYPVKDEGGAIRQVVLMHVDITARVQAEEALRESEERYRIIAETAQDAMVTIDEESRITFSNPVVEKLFGFTSAELQGKSLTLLMPERFRQAHFQAMRDHLATGERHLPWGTVEMPGLHRDGREIPLEISYGEYVKNGKHFFIGIARDITKRKKAEDTIKYQAYHNLLTGLPNRPLLMIHLDRGLAQVRRNGKKLGVAFLDLDRFKSINDTLGHAIGDQLIREVAGRLRAAIGETDTLAHVGADEFVLLLPEVTPDGVPFLIETIMAALRRPFRIDSREVYLTASIGISIFPEDGGNPEALLMNADIAMTHAKEQGRDNYQFFNTALNVRTVERLLFENSLRRTLERGQLVVHYQPLVNIATREITCLEALVRWHHPELGLLHPARFIPLAEEMGFTAAIDEWVLESACRQRKAWGEAGCETLCVTVNLSARQFLHPELPARVSKVLEATGLDPRHLDIEITESTAMKDIDLAVPNLRKLKEMGIKLSIDDFGTGYSSLTYLKRFPIRSLKIDQSFIRDVATDLSDQAIVKAVIVMGHHLRLKIIAEGVETEEQLAFLRSTECDEIQGFLYSEPLPPGKIGELLAAGAP